MRTRTSTHTHWGIYVRECVRVYVSVSRVFHRHLIENNSSVSATRAVNERETRMSVATAIATVLFSTSPSLSPFLSFALVRP